MWSGKQKVTEITIDNVFGSTKCAKKFSKFVA